MSLSTLSGIVSSTLFGILVEYGRVDRLSEETRKLRWESKGFLPRMPDSLEKLDLLLIQVAKARQVRVDGIHLQSLDAVL